MDYERGMIDTCADEVDHVPIPVRVPPGHWRRDDTHLPLPVTPMTDSVTNTEAAFSAACAEFGLLIEPRFTTIGGWSYLWMAPVGARPNRPSPPGWLLPLLLRLSPEARKRMRRSRVVARTGYADQVVKDWATTVLPSFERRITALRAKDPGTMPDPHLIDHVTTVVDLVDDGTRAHFRVNVPNWLAMGDLWAVCRDLLGWGPTEVTALLAGLSARSSEPARKLAELAGTREDSPEFTEYVRTYGSRALTMELADPTISELPGLIWALLRDQTTQGYDPAADTDALARRRAETADLARGALRGKDLLRFDKALSRAVEAYPVREDNVFFTHDVPYALLRYAVLEVGERLRMRGQLSNQDDVFHLRLPEAVEALTSREGQQALVALRKGEHLWALANPGPTAYGPDPGPPPSARWLRWDVRQSMSAMLLVADHVLATDLSNRTATPDMTTLTGIAGSPGRYRGPARILRSEAEFGKLRAGDVLVCPATRASWSVLFPSAGAVVTNAGGVLSHPAIIAREHRIPAVVATAVATEVLRDGQIVTVDGTRGTVEVEA
jgi:phosphohistidine swiveling domain-containing protein